MIKEISRADSGDFKAHFSDNLKKSVSKESDLLENNASYVTAAYES